MSIMNEYTIQLLAQQRHAELIAEAANDRLVRIARSGRPSWRQRILGGVNRTGAVPRTHTSRPAQVH
jgi:hypothetical protein